MIVIKSNHENAEVIEVSEELDKDGDLLLTVIDKYYDNEIDLFLSMDSINILKNHLQKIIDDNSRTVRLKDFY